MKAVKQNRGIKSQLFTAQISLVLISTISFFILSSVYLYTQNTSMVFRDIEHTNELTTSQADRIITQLENTVYYITVNTDIPEILSSGTNGDHITRLANRNTITNTWTALETAHTYPVDFKLYIHPDNESILLDGVSFLSIESAQSKEWYNDLLSKNIKMIYRLSHEDKSFSIISKLYAPTDYTKLIGILNISIDSSVITTMLAASSSKDTFSIMTADDGSFLTGKSEFLPTAEDILKTAKEHDSLSSAKLSDKSRYFITSNKTTNRVFTISTLSKIDRLHVTIAVMLFILTLILIIVSIIAFLISWRRSLPLVNAFNALSAAMKKMNMGEFKKLNIYDDMDDNIAETYTSYNQLTETLTSLIQYNSEYETNLKTMELNFLGQQIKPHFLYNTLNTMQGLVKSNDRDKVLKLINSLSRFYRFSLHNSDNIVELSTEITHITHYINIENFKFNDAIILNINLPEELMSMKVPKLILQPLIENAVHHGIREKIDGTGTVSISHKTVGDDVFLFITDDGVGIPESRIEEIKNGNSIGYLNTDKRIRLFCGDGYGLDIESVEGKYTKIIVKLRGNL